MSALSGITVSPDLSSTFADAVQSKSTRFIKICIENELLVHALSVPISGTLKEDLKKLQDQDILQDDTPAYVLVKLDPPSLDWLSIFYVPDSAKMLYASTRTLLLRSLGSTLFTDSIFATSKEDLNAESYESHLRHIAAAQPLSAREQEMVDLKAAESQSATYQGSSARSSPLGTGVGLNWSKDVEQSVTELGLGNKNALVIITIDPQTETLTLHSTQDIDVDSIGTSLPQTEPCYALASTPIPNASDTNGRQITFIYSCPSESPIKFRMLYSSGSTTTYQAAKNLLASLTPPVILGARKIETSEPKELNEKYLMAELGVTTDSASKSVGNSTKPFAKPKGPPRRR